jgi:hypothetical protein
MYMIHTSYNDWYDINKEAFGLKGGVFLDHFFVGVIPNGFYDYEESETLPAHDVILHPLLTYAQECYVYGLNKDTELFHQCTDILSLTRNKYQLDLKKKLSKDMNSFGMQQDGRGVLF